MAPASEKELNRLYWEASVNRIIARVEEYSQDWRPNGPSEHVKNAIINVIRNMPVPGTR